MRGILVAAVMMTQTISLASAALDLSGEWRVRLDRNDEATSQSWFKKLDGEPVKLPGSLTENKIGDDITTETPWTGNTMSSPWFTAPQYEKYRQPGNVKVPFWLTPLKYYKGRAVYQREIEVPANWRGKSCVLFLERPHWETRTWIDDREIGSQESLSTPHEHDLGQLSPGRHLLTVSVDNRMYVDVGQDAHSVSDHTQTNWNGVVGRIELQAREPVSVQHIRVIGDVKCQHQIGLTVENRTGKAFAAEALVEMRPASGQKDRQLQQYTEKVNVTSEPLQQVVINGDLLCNCEDWDEFNPALYKLTAVLTPPTDVAAASRTEITYGQRQFRTYGSTFTVNGRAAFMRGTLECAVFPKTGYPPTDVKEWERILNRAKEYGLNHIRFHSWCPPEAAFVAADRLGVYFSIECASWAVVGEREDYDKWLRREADRIMKWYGHHPSFCMLLYGNEPHGKNHKAFLTELVKEWKSKDPIRRYSSGAGWPLVPPNEFHVTPEPRIQRWGEQLKSRINARPPATTADYSDFIRKYRVPVISHEIGQWCVYPNLKEREKYTGVTRAYNFDIFYDSLKEHGMADQAISFLHNSGKLQVLCYKEDIESALRTPNMGGFQLLGLTDFPGQGTALVGVLDPFWDDKGYVTAPEFRRFCSETVPLARLEKRVWTADETLTASAEIAHFGAGPIRNAKPVWKLTAEKGELVASGSFEPREIPLGNGIALGQIEAKLPADSPARKLVLSVALEGTPYENTWDVWVYPAKVEPKLPESVQVTTTITKEIASALENGASVLLLPDPNSTATAVPPGFSSIFWNTAWTRGQAPHTLGIVCDPMHAALKSFPTDTHSNWQWWYLVHDSHIIILDKLAGTGKPIVQVIDDWVTNRRLALLVEYKVGKGRLLACGMNLKADNPDPVKRQMLQSICEYLAGDAFKPQVSIEATKLADLVW